MDEDDVTVTTKRYLPIHVHIFYTIITLSRDMFKRNITTLMRSIDLLAWHRQWMVRLCQRYLNFLEYLQNIKRIILSYS